jgi:hypothetical protein
MHVQSWGVQSENGMYKNCRNIPKPAEIDAHKGKTGQALQPWSKPGDIRYMTWTTTVLLI